MPSPREFERLRQAGFDLERDLAVERERSSHIPGLEQERADAERKELLELLIKQAGVHEGKWILMTTFSFSAGNLGPAPELIAPGAVIVINNIGIQRAQADTAEAMTLDASVVNPAPAST